MSGAWEISLGEMLSDAAAARPDHVFVEIGGEAFTYAEFHDAALRTAGLYAGLGVGPGDRVCLVLPNCPEVMLAWFGLALLGAVAVPINTAYKRDEIAYILADCAPKALVAHADFAGDAGAAAEMTAGLDQRLLVGADHEGWTSYADAFAAAAPHADPPHVAPDAVSCLVYTSGTTGAPKGVMITHAMYAAAGQGFAQWTQATQDDRFFTCLPFFHANSHYYSTIGALAAHATLIVAERFSASRFWDQVRAARATVVNFIGMMITVLSKQPPDDADADNDVRVMYGSPAFAPEVLDAFEKRFGAEIIVGFGMTETCYGTIEALGEERRPFSCGRARQHPDPAFVNEVRIWDEAGNPAPPGAPGEIVIRNPVLTPGYWGNEQATREALRGGWLHTGDMARMDGDGHLYFVDRKKDVIRRRGENISSQEVEAVLKRHPAVLDAAVVAVPSELGEDEVKAYVIEAAGETLDPAALVAWCAEHLARFKVPRYVEAIDDFPRTPSLRVRKEELKRMRPDPTRGCYDAESAG